MEVTGQALWLSRQGAQAIVEEVGAIVGQHINMMDPEGYVIASTDPERIGTLHEGARKIIREHLDELYVRDEEATLTSRPGLNLPVYQAGSIAGVIGITGRYEDVAGYGQIVKKMVEILIRENAEQDERRMGQRVLNRFLEDWVLGSGLLQNTGGERLCAGNRHFGSQKGHGVRRQELPGICIHCFGPETAGTGRRGSCFFSRSGMSGVS